MAGASIRIELNIAGVNALMTDPAVQADLDERAARMADAAGEGFEASPGRPHKWVARAYVHTATAEAMRAEATDRALTRAIDAGRG